MEQLFSTAAFGTIPNCKTRREKNLCVGLTNLQANISVYPAAENLLVKFNLQSRVELQSSSSRTNQFQCCFTSKETIGFTRDGEPRTASTRLLSSEPIKPGYGCFSQYPGTLTVKLTERPSKPTSNQALIINNEFHTTLVNFMQ